MTDQKANKVFFLLGDIIGMAIAWIVNPEHAMGLLWIVIGGFVGGFASMGGKELFTYLKTKIKGHVEKD